MKEDDRPEDAIEVPDAPPVPGLTFRGYRDEGDLPRLLEVYNECQLADGWSFAKDLETFQNIFRNLKNTEPEKDVVLVKVDGRVVGFSTQLWEKEDDRTLVFPITIKVVPGWRGHGIRRAMLRRCEARAREVARGSPETQEHLTSIWVSEDETSMIAILEKAGWRPARHFYEMLRSLDRPIQETPMPEGTTLRVPRGEDEYRKVFDALFEALEDNWGIAQPQEEDYQRFLGRPTFQPENWMVAWHGDQVAGTVLSWINEKENEALGRSWGYTEDITVRRPFRRQGLATALISRSLAMLRDRGMTHANLGVDTENQDMDLDLYIDLDYQVYKNWMVYRKPLVAGP